MAEAPGDTPAAAPASSSRSGASTSEYSSAEEARGPAPVDQAALDESFSLPIPTPRLLTSPAKALFADSRPATALSPRGVASAAKDAADAQAEPADGTQGAGLVSPERPLQAAGDQAVPAAAAGVRRESFLSLAHLLTATAGTAEQVSQRNQEEQDKVSASTEHPTSWPLPTAASTGERSLCPSSSCASVGAPSEGQPSDDGAGQSSPSFQEDVQAAPATPTSTVAEAALDLHVGAGPASEPHTPEPGERLSAEGDEVEAPESAFTSALRAILEAEAAVSNEVRRLSVLLEEAHPASSSSAASQTQDASPPSAIAPDRNPNPVATSTHDSPGGYQRPSMNPSGSTGSGGGSTPAAAALAGLDETPRAPGPSAASASGFAPPMLPPAWGVGASPHMTADESALADTIKRAEELVSRLDVPYQEYIRNVSRELTRLCDERLMRQVASTGGSAAAAGGGGGGGSCGGATPYKGAEGAKAVWMLVLEKVRWPHSAHSGGGADAAASPASVACSPWAGHSSMMQLGSVLGPSQAPRMACSLAITSGDVSACGPKQPHRADSGDAASAPTIRTRPHLQPLSDQAGTPAGPLQHATPGSAVSSSCSHPKAVAPTAPGAAAPGAAPGGAERKPPPRVQLNLAAKIGGPREPPKPTPRCLGRGLSRARPAAAGRGARADAGVDGAAVRRCKFQGPGLDLRCLPYADAPDGGAGCGKLSSRAADQPHGGLTARSRVSEKHGPPSSRAGAGKGGAVADGRGHWNSGPAHKARQGEQDAAAAEHRRRVEEAKADLEQKRRRILAAVTRAAEAGRNQHASGRPGAQAQQAGGGGGGAAGELPLQDQGGARAGGVGASPATDAQTGEAVAADQGQHQPQRAGGLYGKLLSNGVAPRRPSAGRRVPSVSPGRTREQGAWAAAPPAPAGAAAAARCRQQRGRTASPPVPRAQQPPPQRQPAAYKQQGYAAQHKAIAAGKLGGALPSAAEALLPGVVWGAGPAAPPPPHAPYSVINVYAVGAADGPQLPPSRQQEERGVTAAAAPLYTALRLDDLLAGADRASAAAAQPAAVQPAPQPSPAAEPPTAGQAGAADAAAASSGAPPAAAAPECSEPATGFVIVSRRTTREEPVADASQPASSLLDLSSLLPAPAWRTARSATAPCASSGHAAAVPVAASVAVPPAPHSSEQVPPAVALLPGPPQAARWAESAGGNAPPPAAAAAAVLPLGGSISIGGALRAGGGGGAAGTSGRRWPLGADRLVLPDMEQMQASSPVRARYAPSDSRASPAPPATAPPARGPPAAEASRIVRAPPSAASKARPSSVKRGGRGGKAGGRSSSAPQDRAGPHAAQPHAGAAVAPSAHGGGCVACSPRRASPPPPVQSHTPLQLQQLQAAAATLSPGASPLNVPIGAGGGGGDVAASPRTPTVRRLHVQSPEDMPLSAAAQHGLHARMAAAHSSLHSLACGGLPYHQGPTSATAAAATAAREAGCGTTFPARCGGAGVHKPRSTPAPLTAQQLQRGGTAGQAPPVWRPAASVVAVPPRAESPHGSPSPGRHRGVGHDCTPNIRSPPRNYDKPWTTPTRSQQHLEQQQGDAEHLKSADAMQVAAAPSPPPPALVRAVTPGRVRSPSPGGAAPRASPRGAGPQGTGAAATPSPAKRGGSSKTQAAGARGGPRAQTRSPAAEAPAAGGAAAPGLRAVPGSSPARPPADTTDAADGSQGSSSAAPPTSAAEKARPEGDAPSDAALGAMLSPAGSVAAAANPAPTQLPPRASAPAMPSSARAGAAGGASADSGHLQPSTTGELHRATSGSYTGRMLARQAQQQGGRPPLAPTSSVSVSPWAQASAATVTNGGGEPSTASATPQSQHRQGSAAPPAAAPPPPPQPSETAAGWGPSASSAADTARSDGDGDHASSASSAEHRAGHTLSGASGGSSSGAEGGGAAAGALGASLGGLQLRAASAAAPVGGAPHRALLEQAAWPSLAEPRVADALATLAAGVAVLDPLLPLAAQTGPDGAPGGGGSVVGLASVRGSHSSATAWGAAAAAAGNFEGGADAGAPPPSGCLSGMFKRHSGSSSSSRGAQAASAAQAAAWLALAAQRPVLLRARVHEGCVEILILRPRSSVSGSLASSAAFPPPGARHGSGASVPPPPPPPVLPVKEHVRVAALTGVQPPLARGAGGEQAGVAGADPADASARWVQIVCMDGGVLRLSACAPADHARLCLGLNALVQVAAGVAGPDAPLAAVPLRGLVAVGGSSTGTGDTCW